MRAIQIANYGSADQLELRQTEDPVRQNGEVLIRVLASGVNFIDTYQRAGLENYRKPLPLILGLEGSGEVIESNTDSEFKPGDIVAWPFHPNSYADLISIPEGKLVRVPKSVGPKQAAAVMLQGLTAHYLVNSTFQINSASVALVHAGSGGVGQLLVQMIKNAGGQVVTTTSTDEKRFLLESLGADHVISYEQFDSKVLEITDNQGVDVVYDGVGKNTYMQSLKSLKRRGLLALFGASSGAVPPLDLQLLNSHGSLFVTRPTLADYTASTDELRSRARDIFNDVELGNLKVNIYKEYSLGNAAVAHRDIESRLTHGKLLLIP